MNAPKTKWSTEDEHTLIEIVEKYENKGKSKQEAFEMVANIINRTKAACASRYRKISKKQNNEIKDSYEFTELNTPINHSSLNLEMSIQFLKNLEQNLRIKKQNSLLKEKIRKIKQENEDLNKKIINSKTFIQKKQKVLINLVD